MALIFRGEFQILYFVYAAFNLEMKRIYFALNILTQGNWKMIVLCKAGFK